VIDYGRPMHRAVLIAVFLAAGCASVSDRPATAGLSRASLVGYWVEDPASCAGTDSGLRYSADGTYRVEGEAGRWTLNGDRLTTRVMSGGEGGPKSGSLRVAMVDGKRMRATWPSGETHIFHRC